MNFLNRIKWFFDRRPALYIYPNMEETDIYEKSKNGSFMFKCCLNGNIHYTTRELEFRGYKVARKEAFTRITGLYNIYG